jgi:hypothetical protein
MLTERGMLSREATNTNENRNHQNIFMFFLMPKAINFSLQ